jgi:integrase
VLARFIQTLTRRLKPSTVKLYIVGVSHAHKQRGVGLPAGREIKRAWAGSLTRLASSDPEKLTTRRVKPASLVDVKKMVDACDDDATGVRDAAVLLVGFSSAIARAALMQVRVDDITWTPKAMSVRLSRRVVRVPCAKDAAYCPVRAIERWIALCGAAPGEPVFRRVRRGGKIGTQPLSPEMVARIVKRYAAAAGLDPREFSSFSLRSGFATSAAHAGVPPEEARLTTGLTTTSLARYYANPPPKHARSLL